MRGLGLTLGLSSGSRGGSAGTPAWVPEGAIGFIDIPNQQAWLEGTGTLTLASALAGYSAADINADGLLIDATHNVGTRLATVFGDLFASGTFTCVVDCTPGAFLAGGYHQIVLARLASTASRLIVENWNADFVYINTFGFYNVTNSAFIAPDTRSRYGMRHDASGLTGSVNGSTAVLDADAGFAFDPDKIYLGCDNTFATSAINGRLKYVEFYSPTTSDAELEALTLPPFLDARFKAGAYELDGAAASLADLFPENAPTNFLHSMVQEDIGWRVTNDPVLDPTASGIPSHAIASAAAHTLLASGFTIVIDYRPNTVQCTFDIGVLTWDGNKQAYLDLAFSPNLPEYANILRGHLKSSVIAPESSEISNDDTILPGGADDVVADMLFRVAYTLNGQDLSISVNGGTTHSMTATNGGPDSVASELRIVSATDDDIIPHPGYMTTVERVRAYPPQSSAMMEKLSAL